MNILILNSILTTPVDGKPIRNNTIRDCMIYSIAIGFKKAGHEVTLVASEEFRPDEDTTGEFKVAYIPCKLKKIFRPDLLPYHPALWSYLWKHRKSIDMVLTSESFSIDTFQAVMLLRKKCLIWQELTAHNRMYKKIPSLFWYNIVVRFLFRNVLIVPRSESAFQFITRYSSCVSPEIVDNGVNIERFNYSLEKENYFIIFCKLIPRKRVDLMIKRFAELIVLPGYTHYRLHIVGDGPLEEELKKLVSLLGIQENVLFKGFMKHDTLNEEIRKAIALLVYTNNDLNMVSITESIISGTPVLTNLLPASSRLISTYGLGIAHDEWGVPELITMIEQQEKYAANCRKMRSYLSNESGAKRLVDLFLNHVSAE